MSAVFRSQGFVLQAVQGLPRETLVTWWPVGRLRPSLDWNATSAGVGRRGRFEWQD